MSTRLKDLAGSGIQQREPILGPIWLKARLAFGQFSVAATSFSITAFTIPPKCIVHGVFVKHSVPFTGPGVTAATVNVGNSTTANAYVSAGNVFGAASATNFALSAPLQSMLDANNPANILIALTTTGANTSALTAGNLEIGLLVSEVP